MARDGDLLGGEPARAAAVLKEGRGKSAANPAAGSWPNNSILSIDSSQSRPNGF